MDHDGTAAGRGPSSAPTLPFPTVLEHSGARARARRRADDGGGGGRFRSGNVFVNNGDTYNGRHVVRRLLARRPADETAGRDDAGLAALTGRQYETYLDRPSAAARAEYLRRAADKSSEADEDGGGDDDDEDEDGDAAVTVLTTLRRPAGAAGARPSGCHVVAKDDGAALMRCAAAVFDVSAGADDEVRDARAALRHVHGELMKCGDEQLARWRDAGAVRCFVLVSTAACWAEESRAGVARQDEPDGYYRGEGQEENDEEEEEEEEERSHGGGEETAAAPPRNPLGRAPVGGRLRAVFELEKAVLRTNATRTRHVFRGRVIAAGVTYGHEQRDLRRVFERAWLGDDDDDDDDGDRDAYAALGRRTVPAVHVDELAELVRVTCARVTCARGRRAGPSADDRAYALAVESPSYEYADVVDAVRDAFGARPRRRGRRAAKTLGTDYGIFENNDGWPRHGHPGGRPVPPPAYDVDADRHGLGRGFALDLILSDLDADHPALRDFVAAPVGRHGEAPSSLVPDARRLAREYVAARGLRPFRVLVSGRPRRVAARVAARLARRYRVPPVDAGRAIDYRADRLRAALDDARDDWRAAAVATDEEWTADESVADELVADGGPTAASAYYAYEEENEHAEDDSYDEEQRRRYMVEIQDIKRALADLNVEREHLGRSVDPVHLLPLIRESLSSYSCRNRGYVMDVYPLSVERMDVIFNGDVDYPNAVVMLSYDPDDPDETAAVVNDDDLEGSRRRSRRNHCHIDRDSDSSEADSSDSYYDRPNNRNEIDVDADDDCAEVNDDENLRDLTAENSYEKNKVEMKRVVKYFTDNRCKILSLKVPFGLIDDTVPNDWQYTGFTDSIVTQVGRPQFADEVYETAAMDTRQSMTTESKTRKTKTMSRTVLEKLNAMREEWNDDIFKAIERDKTRKYDKNAKIQNYVNTNILPKLLKEISPIGDGDDHSVSRFSEKVLNKTKLCRKRPDED